MFTLNRINSIKRGRPQTPRRTVNVSTGAAMALQAAVDAQISDAALWVEEWLRKEGGGVASQGQPDPDANWWLFPEQESRVEEL